KPRRPGASARWHADAPRTCSLPLDEKGRDRGIRAGHDSGGRTKARRRGSAMISGTTTLIAHVGYPTFAFKAPLIYNPWFEKNDVDAVVVPMGVKAEDYPAFLASLFKLTNIRGA